MTAEKQFSELRPGELPSREIPPKQGEGTLSQEAKLPAAEGGLEPAELSVLEIPRPPLPAGLPQGESAEGVPTLRQTMEQEGAGEAERKIQEAKISPGQLEFLLARIFEARTRKPKNPEPKQI